MFEVPEVGELQFDPKLNSATELTRLRDEAERIVKVLFWKRSLGSDFPPIYTLFGATGIGKSTIFNSLIGRPISHVSAIRPSTSKAIIYIHKLYTEGIESCPFVNKVKVEIVYHEDERLAQLILIDTPDYDTRVQANREIADDYFTISDVLIFAVSQGKYADFRVHEMAAQAGEWGKFSIYIMNKVDSETAWDHFVELWEERGYIGPKVKIPRVTPAPDIIGDLNHDAVVSSLFTNHRTLEIKQKELTNLQNRANKVVGDLLQTITEEIDYVISINSEIQTIHKSAEAEMLNKTNRLINTDLQRRAELQLQNLLQKYDLLRSPRSALRGAVRKSVQALADVFVQGKKIFFKEPAVHDQEIGNLFSDAKEIADLKPLIFAVSELNQQVADLVTGIQGREDLKNVAAEIPRWDQQQVKVKYEEAFPAIEKLLEKEFDKLKKGLSTKDEYWLYGTSAATALALITAEIVVGGGFTLLDAVLDTAIMPFIPKFLLDIKIVNKLRDIGEKVDNENKKSLRRILLQQAYLYIEAFDTLLPAPDKMQKLRSLQMKIGT